jgi:predicted NAD/FAD-dependent oxidoreductase
MSQAPTVAVIGAGIAGLSAAHRLRERGYDARVFEKSRGLGGRCATRRSDGLSFDHGAQYFTVRERAFAAAVASPLEEGYVARWEPRVVRIRADGAREPGKESVRYVGVPGMSALGRALAGSVEVARDTRIVRVRRRRRKTWELESLDHKCFGDFDAVLVTCPAPQAAELVADVAPRLAAVCGAIELQPCWAAMAAFKDGLELDFDAAFVEDEFLAWTARNSSKPGRRAVPECWVLHGGPSWSADRQTMDPEEAAGTLLGRFCHLTGVSPPRTPVHLVAHRWSYARSAPPRTGGPLLDETSRIGVAGDWVRGDRIEEAFMSGLETADAIAALL